MKTIFTRVLAYVLLATAGIIAVNAKVIIPLGTKYQQPWEAKYFYAKYGAEGPAEDWYTIGFDDSSWGTLQGPISSEGNLSYYNTLRPDAQCRYWVRHHFTLDKVNPDHAFYLLFSHDDECQIYINDILITNQGGAYTNQTVQLTTQAVAALNEGDNVLSMYVYDSGGGAQCLDFGLYEDDSDFQNIVQSSDVQLSFSNDQENPWWQDGWDEAYNGNRGKTNSSSCLQMTFSSTLRTELKFDWYKYRYYSGGLDLELYIDGVLASSTTNGSWTTPRFYIEPGDHVVMFRDTIGSQSYDTRSGIRNICLRQIKPLESAVLTANSQPLTFTNNSATPWTIEDGYVQNGNYGYANTSSSFSTTFTLNKTSKLSYEVAISASSSGNHRLNIYVNGVQWEYWTAQRDFTHDVWALEPGTYTVEWKDTTTNSNVYYSRIRNIELSNKWVNVELATAGTLGYEVLYSPGIDVLTDVEFLKVTGPMNASDWTDIKKMTNLLALDLSEAQFTELPNQVFDGKSLLSSVILPEGIKTIGEYAFRGTTIRRINIPSTVTSIGQFAFASTPLVYLSFADNAQIETIGAAAFYNCNSLLSVTMPNTVSYVGYSAFQDCNSLKTMIFSDGIKVIEDHVCWNCTALEQLHLPQGLERINTASFSQTVSLKEVEIPSTVNEIRSYAFDNCGIDSLKLPISMQYLYRYAFTNCRNLKYVELPSYLEDGAYLGYYDRYYYATGWDYYYDRSYYGYRYNFSNCTALEKVVMRAATPPAIAEDPFNGARAKGLITLVVPSFSVVNYKLDTYWYQFGTIVEGDDVDYWRITSPLMMTNNRRMQGKPDVDLYFGGQLTVGGNAPFQMGQFNMYVNESNPGRLLNTCEAITADAASVRFSVDANKWYFFTPIYDVNVSDITVTGDASYVFRYYDAQNRAANGASGSWKNVDTEKLIAGQGYIFHCNKACEIIFPADAVAKSKLFGTQDVTRTLTVNEATTTADRSWNYVGNPYPCYYDIYYMDFTAPITVWNGSTYQAYSIADDEFVLRPMQSFFVQKPDAVDEIIFHKEGRQLTTTVTHTGASHAPAHTAGRASRFLFNLTITGDGQNDETRVVINNEASLGYEIERDAAKFLSFDTSVPQIYTTDIEGNSYAINERPIMDGQVQLAYYAGKAGAYTIRAQRTDGKVWLYDSEQNCTINLTEGDYTFQSEATNDVNNSRFTLTFEVDDATGINNGQWSMADSQSDAWYSLDGRHLSGKPTQRGLYIVGGRKVTIK